MAGAASASSACGERLRPWPMRSGSAGSGARAVDEAAGDAKNRVRTVAPR